MSGKLFEVNKKTKCPGPGQYQAFSEFGIYRSKFADENPITTANATATLEEKKWD